MSQQIDQLQLAAERSVADFLALQLKQVVLLHHNDCDGLTSAAILTRAFERQHLKILRYCLEKPYPQALAEIFDNPLLENDCAFVFTDFASGMLSTIKALNNKKLAVFVIDHHQIEPAYLNAGSAADDKLFILNCRAHAVDGSKECSASAVAYLFASLLSKDNSDLLPLAVLGALGDGQYENKFKFFGLNQRNFVQACKLGAIDKDCNFLGTHNRTALEFVTGLNALGSLAYFSKGPDIALKGLAEGFDQRYLDIAGQYVTKFEQHYSQFNKDFELQHTPKVQWFILPEDFSEYGVKTVGLVCERLIEAGLIDNNKIVAGFQRIPDYIPGLANIKFNQYKVSLRLPTGLRDCLQQQPQFALDVILPKAIHQLAGFADACHPHAAAATVKIGQERELIDIINTQLLNKGKL